MAEVAREEGKILKLFNTLTRRIESFTAGPEVGLYVCGVTPYDTTHIGHARTYIVFDVLLRHLLHHGHKVNYVQNITDLDDSILKRAAELGESYRELGDRFTAVYLEDVAALGLVPATSYPRATEAIEEMKEMIWRLLAAEHAYRTEAGDVYLGLAGVAHYGELSRLDRAAMLAIESDQDGSTVDDPHKGDPLDILLWRGERPGEPAWESPWGPGRPGWHLECSTLAMRHLGPTFDIHGGGDDLVFPHHEAEIAQAETVSGVRPFARLWMHAGMVRFKGAKMSKSDGNMVFVRDLLDRYPVDGLRLNMLQTHYREPLDFDEGALAASCELAGVLSEAAHAVVTRREPDPGLADLETRFEAALDDDLDTPGAIVALGEVAQLLLTAEPDFAARKLLRALSARLGLSLES
ncbi:cysteine--tRNA ligase [soil metagenome]